MTRFKVWLAKRLRYFADRIDYEHAMVLSMYRFEMIPGVGAVVYKAHEVPSSAQAVKLWYAVDEYAEKRELWS